MNQNGSRNIALSCPIALLRNIDMLGMYMYVMLVQRDSSFSSETKLSIYEADGKQNRLASLIYFQNNLILNLNAINSDG